MTANILRERHLWYSRPPWSALVGSEAGSSASLEAIETTPFCIYMARFFWRDRRTLAFYYAICMRVQEEFFPRDAALVHITKHPIMHRPICLPVALLHIRILVPCMPPVPLALRVLLPIVRKLNGVWGVSRECSGLDADSCLSNVVGLG